MLTYCEGERVYLRFVELSDAPLIAAWKTDPYVRRMALYPGIEITEENQRESIARALQSEDDFYLIIVVKATNTPIGYIRFTLTEGPSRDGFLQIALGEERGRGYGKEAVTCLVTRLFSEGIHRIDAEAFAYNVAGLRLLESVGFVREGVKREAFFDGEKRVDIVFFGLLEEDLR